MAHDLVGHDDVVRVRQAVARGDVWNPPVRSLRNAVSVWARAGKQRGEVAFALFGAIMNRDPEHWASVHLLMWMVWSDAATIRFARVALASLSDRFWEGSDG